MNPVVLDIAFVVVAFLLGSIPFGIVVGRLFFGIDVRKMGSGNIGAANALRALGRTGGIAVLVLDVLKGWLPAAAGGTIGGEWLAVAAGLAAVFGHCFSPWLGFRGGKGVATSLGVIAALSWQAALAFVVVWVVLVAAFGFASLGSLCASIAMPFVLWYFIGRPGLVYGIVSALVIVVMHRENIARLANGSERRLRIGRARSEDESRSQAT